MDCTSPLKAFQTEDGSVIFSDFGRPDVIRDLKLRCGQCMACRVTLAQKWSVRCVHEAKLYGHGLKNSFLTLTVDDEWMPEVFPTGGLDYRPFQLFEKRLRFKQSDVVRFRMCGEYGDLSNRPHFHALEFNCWPDDAKKWRKSGDGYLYRSAELEKLWPYGNVEFGRVTPESAAYVNGYVMKKLTGDAGDAAYRRIDAETGEIINLQAPFSRSSTRPAIGIPFFEKYVQDYINSDGVILRGGANVGMPKAYDNWLEKHMPEQLEELKLQRELSAEQARLLRPEESTATRRAVRDEVLRARLRDKRIGKL